MTTPSLSDEPSTQRVGAPLCSAPLLPDYGYARTAEAWPGGTDVWWLAVEGPGYLALLDSPSDDGKYRTTDYRYARFGWIGASDGGFVEVEGGLRLLGYPAGNLGESCLAPLRAPSTSPSRPTTKVMLAGNLDASAQVLIESFNPQEPSATSNYSTSFVAHLGSLEAYWFDVNFRQEGNGWVRYFVLTEDHVALDGTWSVVGQGQLWFDVDGALARVENPPVCVELPDREQCITLDFGDPKTDGGTGLRGFTYTDGPYELTSQTVDGAPAGTALFVSVNEDGVVSVEYDNDEVLPIGNLVIARFAKESQLGETDRDVFVETTDSGPPTFFSARASIESEAAGPE